MGLAVNDPNRHTKGNKLSPRHFLCVDLVMSGSTVADIAEKLGVTTKTIYDWLNRIDVKQEIQRVREEQRTITMRRLDNAGVKASRTLTAVLDNPNATNRDKITAAQIILDRCGFNPKTQLEVTGSEGMPIPLVHLTYNQILELIDRIDTNEQTPFEETIIEGTPSQKVI